MSDEWDDVFPAELLRARNWCGAKLSRRHDGGLEKFPIDMKTGDAAKSNDPSTWCDFDTALKAWRDNVADCLMIRLPEGVGMIDFDRIKDIKTNREVRSYVRQCASYAEYSLSEWLHILFRVSAPIPTTYKELFDSGVIEIYTERFCAVTGDVHPDSRPELRDLTGFLKRQFPKLFEAQVALFDEVATGGFSLLADDAVMRHALAAENADKFRALNSGVWRDLNPAWTHSEADLAYVCHLVFWCNGDAGLIDRLFTQSGLYRRKWDKTCYRRSTIHRALKLVHERYDPASKKDTDFERIYRRIRKVT